MSIRKQMPNGKCHHLKPSCISEVVFRVVFLSGIPQSCFEGIHLLCASNIRGAFIYDYKDYVYKTKLPVCNTSSLRQDMSSLVEGGWAPFQR